MNKTPKFDSAIEAILSKLAPHMRTCVDCNTAFTILESHIDFYKKMKVPPPTHCPSCRAQRKLSFANYSNIYRRACDFPDHSDTMISLVAPVMPWKVYDYAIYYSDAWDPRQYGRDVELAKPFFDSYRELLLDIPHPGVRRGPSCENSEFAFYGRGMKDCYYVFGSWNSEDIQYGASIFDTKNTMDSYHTRHVTGGYEDVMLMDSYKVRFGYFSSDCVDCDFIFDCRNCSNCFGCVNLRNKQYCWFNEQLTKEEYLKRKKELDLGSRKVLEECQKTFWQFVKDNPIRAIRTNSVKDVSGNDIDESKNCHGCFQVEKSENVSFGQMLSGIKDSMDVYFGGKAEKLYETQNVGVNSSDVKFSYAVKDSRDLEYSMSCNNCSNCFGCVGLKNISYAIFNKVYEPEEYFACLDEIKTEMLARGEYGEFFPMSLAPYPYNSSFANVTHPIDSEEAHRRGLYWQDDTDPDTSGLAFAETVPDNIRDVSDDIIKKALTSSVSGQPFRITSRELSFYRTHGLPLPVETPKERIVRRFGYMSDFKIYKESCAKCGAQIDSAYRAEDGYIPYCQACFQNDFA